jgi:hypothetical protein
MRGISWLAAKTGQLLKKDAAPWSNIACLGAAVRRLCVDCLYSLSDDSAVGALLADL